MYLHLHVIDKVQTKRKALLSVLFLSYFMINDNRVDIVISIEEMRKQSFKDIKKLAQEVGPLWNPGPVSFL